MRSSFATFSYRPVALANEYWHSALLRWVIVCRAKRTKCEVAHYRQLWRGHRRSTNYQLATSRPVSVRPFSFEAHGFFKPF